MKKISNRTRWLAASTAVMAALSIGVVAASAAAPPPSNAMQVGMGVN